MIADHPIATLDRKELREFGLVTGGIVAALFGVFFPWLLERAWPVWPWLVLAVLGSLALIAPDWLGPIHRGWMKLGLLISRVTTPLVLGLGFFLVISPIAIVWQLRGRDPMQRSFDERATSYRVKSRRRPIKDLEQPF